MPKLSSRKASIYAAVTFALTIGMSYFLPGYTITIGGLLVVIFLSVFIGDRKWTIIAGVGSTVVIICFIIYNKKEPYTSQAMTEHIFVLSLVLFTTIIALYVKSLYKGISFDRTHLTSLFENATEGIILTNKDGLIILVNPAAERMFNYNAKELKDKKIEILVPQKFRHGHVKLREGFHTDPQDRVMGHGRDLHGTKKNGEEFPVEVSLSFYKENEGSYVIAFIVDITHRKKIEDSMRNQQKELEKVTNDIRKLNTELEAKVEERTIILREALMKLEQSQEELNEALDKERQLNEIKSQFVSMASHEFRTPLSTVLSSASLLSKYITTDSQEKRDKHIKRIKESVKDLNDILEDFLSLGKLDEGKVAANFSEFDLNETITDTVEEMKGLLKNNQEINFLHDGNTLVFSDKKLLKNILINLITNAIKFSEDNIQISSSTNKGIAELQVVDGGIGISPEDQQHLFSSFFRGKNATNIQGTGLGLHIVKRYVDLLGGEITLKSQLSKGTTISVSIPITKNSL